MMKGSHRPLLFHALFARADAPSCASRSDAALQEGYYRRAVSSLEDGLEYDKTNARAWLQLGQLNQELTDYEAAIPAFENA
ncbi:MAG: hypothetical protein R3E31_26755 [Chloroflexota bacterium]